MWNVDLDRADDCLGPDRCRRCCADMRCAGAPAVSLQLLTTRFDPLQHSFCQPADGHSAMMMIALVESRALHELSTKTWD
jgi:hypothetical protein